ncbi:MAG: hypothetical protein KGH64_01740 [Candidatus Micrarchaeota archaeon]|nr:hypothetical protein [Candidatus Micrarchaeota archaeon]MDE1859129.1 hypothetical protein [Candidatus Micrarchaeota archaeon]
MDYIDDEVESVNRWEERQVGSGRQSDGPGASTNASSSNKVRIGTVDRFFDKISVAAIKLSSRLAVGDIIEIGKEDEAIRQRVDSMQINGEDVEEALEGDDVGIKLKYRIDVGSDVYRIEGTSGLP